MTDDSNSNFLVSIVIPCYNAEETIAEAIESALAQDWPHKEIIVVDDGSADASYATILRYKDRIRIKSGPNRGGCAARNEGVRMATGEWIQFLDSDDVLLPQCVSSKMKYIASNPDEVRRGQRPCSRLTTFATGDRLVCSPAWFLTHHDWRTILEAGAPQTAAPLLKREDLMKVGGFREQLPSSQEYDLFLRLAIFDKIVFSSIGFDGVVIRVSGNSTSRRSAVRVAMTNFDATKHVLKCLQEKRALMEEEKEAFAIRFRKCAKNFAWVGKGRKFNEAWRMANELIRRDDGSSPTLRAWIFFIANASTGLIARLTKMITAMLFGETAGPRLLNNLRRIRNLLRT